MAGKLEKSSFFGLLGVIAFSAIPNGSVDEWTVSLVVILIGICSCLRLVESFLNNKFEIAESRLMFPIVGFIVLALLQLSFPVSIENTANVTGFGTFNSEGTKEFIVLATGLLLAGEVLFRYTKSTSRLRALVYLVLVVGVGSALFGIVRLLLPLPMGFDLNVIVGNSATIGQFINRNHFALLMEMTIGLLIGLVFKERLSKGRMLFYCVMIAVTTFITITANSRGGIISLIGLTVFAVFVHKLTPMISKGSSEVRENAAWWGIQSLRPFVLALSISLLFLVIGIVVIAFVGGDPVASRIESIHGEIAQVEGEKFQRSHIWRDTFELIRNRPVAGVGFGGFSNAITSFDKSNGKGLLQQAHNDYLELLAAGGFVGLVLGLIFAFLVMKRIREQLTSENRFRRACCFGATVGMFGVLIHSFVDFGLHAMINALIFMVLLVIATARIEHDRNTRNRGDEI